MSDLAELRRRLEAAGDDPEFARLGAGLSVTLRLRVGEAALDLAVEAGKVAFVPPTEPPGLSIVATAADWAEVLRQPPPPTFHAFTALDLANPRFAVEGDRLLLAQARPLLERLFERLTASPPRRATPAPRDLGQITGQYGNIEVQDTTYEVYFESAGAAGRPLLFLHTAGADSRQFQAQLADGELARRFAMLAPDLPFHGRSMPPRSWDGGAYRLSAATYRDWCVAFIEQVIGEPAIVCGGSMGAAMSLVLAAERPDLVLGVVAVEPPFQSKGRRNPYQHHVAVHGGLHNASFVRGLMSPESPEADRRRAAWIYSQGAPGIYTGDLAFYSEEFDGADVAPRVDVARTPVALLCGEYDYSANPADGHKLAALLPGARIEVMPGLGHFPMCENPDFFRPYLVAALDHVEARLP